MTSTSSDNFKESLKQQADIVRIVGDYVKLKKAGAQNFSGLCPFHAEKTPSFSVHATRQFYHCFGAGSRGFVMKKARSDYDVSEKSHAGGGCGIPPSMGGASSSKCEKWRILSNFGRCQRQAHVKLSR